MGASDLLVLRGVRIEIDDLHGVVSRGGRDDPLGPDGIHFTEAAEAGYELIGQAVAEAIRARLAR